MSVIIYIARKLPLLTATNFTVHFSEKLRIILCISEWDGEILMAAPLLRDVGGNV